MPRILLEKDRTRRGSLLILALGCTALSACAGKAPRILPPDPGPAVTTSTNSAGMGNHGPVPGSQADFQATLMGRDVIYFDTDKYNIDSEDQQALSQQARYLQQFPNVRVTIEGHCDERGTRDYNLALGERRANAAKNYLASLGISPDRISTVSYGKERPAALGSTEEAWAKNRRAVTVVIG